MITRTFIVIHLSPRRWVIGFLLHHNGVPMTSWGMYTHKKYTTEWTAQQVMKEYRAAEKRAAEARDEGSTT